MILNPLDPVPLEKRESFLVTHDASEQFIGRIQAERQLGYGFVPLIGAGFSAPSGVPLVQELRTYLQRCLWMALGQSSKEDCWHPCSDQWPAFVDREFNRKGRPSNTPWARLYGQLLSLWKQSDAAGAPDGYILAEALGAAEDWRNSLLFLSRLRHSRRGTGESRIFLGAPQPELIDSCLREALTNKYPALNHNMLGVLAGLLRLNLVLTTNFDDLLERAFAEARNHLEVFEVHIGDGLPHWSAVSQVRSLVKLHGNRHALRADYSLDAEPSERDKRTFLEYLIAGKNKERGVAQDGDRGLAFENHLLVMGVGATEDRTLALIEYAWKHLSKDFKVFWLCYSDKDVKAIKTFAEQRLSLANRERSDMPVVLKHTNYGLLLLQLYQTIRRNLPPFGGLFPSMSRLPLPPLPAGSSKRKGNRFAAEVVDRLKSFQRGEGLERLKLVVATSERNARGVTSACSDVFRQMETDNACLWLDMNDVSSTDNLFEVLLEAAYIRLGQDNWVPTHHETQRQGRAEEIQRLVLSGDKPWIIFINARETPGANVEEPLDPKTPNGWLDEPMRTDRSADLDDHSCSTEEFRALVEQLCGRESPRISVVLLCREGEPRSGLLQSLRSEEAWRNCILPLRRDMYEQYSFSEIEVVAKAIQWTGGDRRKQRFLHALVLMQRPRLLATIWSEPVTLTMEESTEVGESREAWVNQLEERGLIRRKAGGFIWLHSPSRALIRRILWKQEELPETSAEAREARAILARWNAIEDEPEIHTKLAKWYEKVLDASEAPAAVFEAIYHLCLATQRYLQLRQDAQSVTAACQSIDAASALLLANAYLVQTRGYGRGSCRRLHHIRRTLCEFILDRIDPDETLRTAIRRLQLVCTEVMRMIAREVGEDRKAFIRHQQYGELRKGLDLAQIPEALRQTGKHDISEGVLQGLRGRRGPNRGIDAAAEWVRWWRWTGMLGTASRSYHAAEKSFDDALRCVIRPLEYPDRGAPIDLSDPLHLAPHLLESQSQELRLEAVRVIEQYAELLLLKYNLDQRLAGMEDDGGASSQSERVNRIKKVRSLVDIGRRLVTRIRSGDQSSGSHEAIAANWCECRLLIHQSVCASLRFQLHSADEEGIGSVMGLLGDSEASLRISDGRRHRSELGIVELHRAETRIQRAEAVLVTGPKGLAVPFAAMCRHLERQDLKDQAREQALREQLQREFTARGGAGLPRVRSLVGDGVRFMDRAEPILRERRRNVWWTTWFFERYLRLISMSVWTSVFEKDTPIPFLGLESAASGAASIADELLDDALRMISADSYRLATIIDAYASCARALQLRLLLEDRSSELPFRRQKMHDGLNKALGQLTRSEAWRTETASLSLGDKNAGVDPNVTRYISAVRGRAGLVYEELARHGVRRK